MINTKEVMDIKFEFETLKSSLKYLGDLTSELDNDILSDVQIDCCC
jgi:hypothetical protein